MKRLLFAIILAALLSACGTSGSIGIIGGADGPTSIIVTD